MTIPLPPPQINWSTLNVLVIGGSGFLGSAICRQLLLRRCRSLSVFNRSAISEDLLAKGVRYLPGSVTDPDALENAVQDADVVFHVAAKTGVWGDPKEFFDINTGATATLIEKILKHRCCRALVHTGSPSAMYLPNENIRNYIEPIVERQLNFNSPYPASKRAAEKIVRAAASEKLPAAVIRPHLIYGPGDPHIIPRLLDRARSGRIIQVGSGKNKVDLTYVENAAWAHLRCAERLLNPENMPAVNGRGFFVSDFHTVNLWKWIHRFVEAVGLHPKYVQMPYPLAYAAGAVSEFFASHAHEPSITRFTAGQLSHSHYFNPLPALEYLGYYPVIDHRTAFQLTVEHFIQKAKSHG